MRKVYLTIGLAVILALQGSVLATMFEDFSSISKWGAGGPNGSISSITTDGTRASLNYAVTTAVGNDYVDFYTDQMNERNDWRGFDSLVINGLNVPVDPTVYVQLKIYAGAWAEYTFAQNGVTSDYTLKLNYTSSAPSLYAWGQMDWSNVQVVKFEVVGDISSQASSGTILMDDIQLVPEPATLAILSFGALVLRRNKK